MPAIENDDELEQSARAAGELLQDIQNYLGDRKNDRGKVRFPRGFITPAATYRARLPRLSSRAVSQNVSYAYMTLDVYRWIANRTDLSAQAMEMIIKEAICLMGSICETVTIRKGVSGLGKKKSFLDRTKRLVEMEVISTQLKTDLDWVWDIRCREHLAEVSFAEWNHYTRDHHNRARRALGELMLRMQAHFGPNEH